MTPTTRLLYCFKESPAEVNILPVIMIPYNSESKSQDLYFSKALSTEGNLRFKIDWASLIIGSEFTVFAWF